MLRRALPILAALLLVALPAIGADPGARSPNITVGAAVNDIALATTEGTLGIATQDPTGRVGVPPGASAPVWYMYTADGRNLLQDGDADVDACDSNGFTTDDCMTHASHVALSADGSRMAVASTADDGNPVLTLVRDVQGSLPAIRGVTGTTMLGTVQDLAMSEDGRTIAVLSNQNQATNPRGHLYVFDWPTGTSSSPTMLWSDTFVLFASDLGMSPDGNAIAVTEDTDHHRYKRSSAGTQVTDTNFSGVGVDAAVANGGKHLSVAGSTQGWFILYNDDTPSGSREGRIRDSADVSLDAVAIRVDATAIAVGNAAGELWVYKVDPSLPTVSADSSPSAGFVGKASLGSPIREVAFARDGKTVAVAYGNSVAQYAVEDKSLAKLWSADLASSAGSIAIDATGARVAAATGTTVIVYEAKHAVSVQVPTLPAATPGVPVSVVVTYANTGNRMVGAAVALDAPDGWTALPDKTSFRVAPDGTATVRINVTAPADAPPGPQDVKLFNTLGAAGSPTTTLRFTVPAMEAWSIAAEGAVSAGLPSGGANGFIVTVDNEGNVDKQPPLTVTAAPAGWTATIAGNEGALEGGSTRQVTVNLQAPAGAAEGAQGKATVSLPGADGSPIVFTGTIGASFSLTLDGPKTIDLVPGGTTQLTLQVTNTGNAPDVYELSAGNLPSGWNLTFPSGDEVAVGNGQSAAVPVAITVPDDADLESALELSVTAKSTSESSKSDSHTFLASLADGDGSETDTKTKSKGSPGAGTLFVLAALAAAFLARRGTKGP
jgi:hypothetical protein